MRGRLEIIADILSVARKPSTKTNIVYSANLNFEQAEKYLENCVECELLEVEEESSKKYVTTKKGYKFLEAMETIGEKINLERSDLLQKTKTSC